MSVESAQQFTQRMSSDEVFRNSLASAKSDAAREELIKEAGFNFSAQELMIVMPKQALDTELTDEQLDAVNGGGVGEVFGHIFGAASGGATVGAGGGGLLGGPVGALVGGVVGFFTGAVKGAVDAANDTSN